MEAPMTDLTSTDTKREAQENQIWHQMSVKTNRLWHEVLTCKLNKSLCGLKTPGRKKNSDHLSEILFIQNPEKSCVYV